MRDSYVCLFRLCQWSYLYGTSSIVENRDRDFDIFTRRFAAAFEIPTLDDEIQIVPIEKKQ